jgi:hypothetical protein
VSLRVHPLPATVLSLALAAAAAAPAAAAGPPVRLSTDPYSTSDGHHATEVEPDSFSHGSAIVAAFQVGRFFDGGAANVGWAASGDSGRTWTTDRFLTGVTTQAGGPFARVSDPAVAYDAKHGVWLIESLALDSSLKGAAVVVSRSTDAVPTDFGAPVTVASAGGSSDFDKNWIACDNTAASPYYGRCYAQWDDFGDSSRIKMSTSSDGGLTWGAPANTAGNASGLGGQPVVQPTGTVVVPFSSPNETAIAAFRSTDGGGTWTAPAPLASVAHHPVAGQIRAGPLPSAEIDGAGRVYVAWQDCRFRLGCAANDIVIASSADGVVWTPPARVPIDPNDSGVDHFVPGLGVDPATSGAGAHLGLAYHYLPDAGCPSAADCQVRVGFVSSLDGGSHWSAAQELAGPMTVSWLVPTSQGYMFGDYVSTSFAADGTAHPLFALAGPQPTPSTFDEAIYTSSPTIESPAGPPPGGNGNGGAPPTGAPPATPRALSRLRVSPRRFRPARRGPSVARALGAVVSYRVTAAGTTTFTLRRAVARGGQRRWKAVRGSFEHVDVAGANRFRFTGRLRGALRAGLYRLTAVPRGAPGVGPARRAHFAILRARRSPRRAATAR